MTVHYTSTGLSDGADIGTPGAGNISDTAIVYPDGHICKITTATHESTHQFGNHGLDYNEDMTTNTSGKPRPTHTPLIYCNIHHWFPH